MSTIQIAKPEEERLHVIWWLFGWFMQTIKYLFCVLCDYERSEHCKKKYIRNRQGLKMEESNNILRQIHTGISRALPNKEI